MATDVRPILPLQEGMRAQFGKIVYKVIRVRQNGKTTLKPVGVADEKGEK